MNTDINFPNLHIYLEHVGKSVNIFGFEIAYYGIIIAVGMLLAVALIMYLAKKSGINEDFCMDVCIYGILFGVIGARIYYVVFAWDIYKDNLLGIFNLREGGLAIYGGVLAGMVSCIVLCKKKDVSFYRLADCVVPGVLVGQIVGRWGNFFNREVFGQYTDSLFAMELPINAIRSMEDVTREMLDHARVVDGVTYIQVHPTFLYESLWNLGILIFLLLYFGRKKFDGELFCYYMFFYGVGRFVIEGVRTDQLKLWNTGIPVSQALAVVLMVVSAGIYLWLMKNNKKK